VAAHEAQKKDNLLVSDRYTQAPPQTTSRKHKQHKANKRAYTSCLAYEPMSRSYSVSVGTIYTCASIYIAVLYCYGYVLPGYCGYYALFCHMVEKYSVAREYWYGHSTRDKHIGIKVHNKLQYCIVILHSNNCKQFVMV
jgi:hypothetical protein